jgi:hypothetical protein
VSGRKSCFQGQAGGTVGAHFMCKCPPRPHGHAGPAAPFSCPAALHTASRFSAHPLLLTDARLQLHARLMRFSLLLLLLFLAARASAVLLDTDTSLPWLLDELADTAAEQEQPGRRLQAQVGRCGALAGSSIRAKSSSRDRPGTTATMSSDSDADHLASTGQGTGQGGAPAMSGHTERLVWPLHRAAAGSGPPTLPTRREELPWRQRFGGLRRGLRRVQCRLGGLRRAGLQYAPCIGNSGRARGVQRRHGNMRLPCWRARAGLQQAAAAPVHDQLSGALVIFYA